ncbi:hypothetical protein C8Q75DRAFT_713105 [Abortiporus biennis]|nr:hypothetical protein C8Q75DRAFT_713105 [Abortiporus biennis]
MADNNVETHISIAAGIIVGLLASFVQSLGLTIQRKSHVQNQLLPEEEQKVEHRRPLWLLGFGIFISSNLFGSIFQIASLPVVILAPLGAVSLLWNAFFARILLGDAFSIWMLIGTILIAGGAILIAVFGILPEPTRSLEDLLVLFSRPTFIAYFSLLGIFVVICLAITHIAEFSYSRRISLPSSPPPLSPLLAPNTAPTILTTAATPATTLDPTSLPASERTPLLDRKSTRSQSPSTLSDDSSTPSGFNFSSASSRTPILIAMSYASFSGIISGMCLLFAKSGVQLLVLTIGGKNQFWRWQAWILVLGLVICALLQLWYMHKGLVLANPTLICPLAFCFYNLSSILNGLIYFDQFSMLSTTHLMLVLLGITILLAGVWIVSFPPSGGFSVDIGPWGSAEEAQVDGSRDRADSHGVYDDEPLPMVPQRTLQQPEQDTISKDLGLGLVFSPTTERDHAYSSLRAHPPTSSSETEPIHSHPRSQTESVVPLREQQQQYPSYTEDTHIHHPLSTSPEDHISPTSPTRRARAATTLPSGSTPRHSFGYPYTSPPGAASGTLTGFSIGLSPMSPGFSLVPKERGRKRRATGMSGVEGAEEGRVHDFRAGVMKRSVSEGDVGSPEWHRSGEYRDDADGGVGEDEPLLEGEGGRRRRIQDEEEGTGEISGGQASRKRWKLLSSILPFKRWR